ncbi:16S rRNA methyltransferase [Buchnera aphidicola (Aphis glycines)]|uniref:Ribosomal RNA small subunit methyltransferase I n=1 Tax=Buchnera aphidicola (Aphis glycines) TaxID=1265350 RepID=A0A0M4HUY2_9GAMM|nr:16S rRNA (cytidine(1402)-2'-O)-methyltransferase [Buchnera aphidicola]ALD15054.1 16S rRNA methyltransferase [Buchnera aphidicola (Aphis glycines)]
MNFKNTGILYIVPTPIGNLSDITYRALKILQEVDLIACENIKHTNILLKHFNIKNILISFNKFNEFQKSDRLIQELEKGKKIALVSSAGTPLINDPGYILIKKCHLFKIQIIPLPGACAAITALSASGVSTSSFCYEGFLPSKKKLRRSLLNSLKKEKRTIILYESKYRVIETVQDIINEIGANRHIVIAREITKKWEIIYGNKAHIIFNWIKEDQNRYNKGENVIIIDGYKESKNINLSDKIINTFTLLRKVLSLKQSVLITSKIHKTNKNDLYQYAIQHEEK